MKKKVYKTNNKHRALSNINNANTKLYTYHKLPEKKCLRIIFIIKSWS